MREIAARDMVVRFVFGAVTSAAAGSLAILFSPIVGGVFLAFPAILAASLTLIAEEEDKAEAREDARGAVVGAAGMAAFAAIGVATFTNLAWPWALAAGFGAWVLAALGIYTLLWLRPGSG